MINKLESGKRLNFSIATGGTQLNSGDVVLIGAGLAGIAENTIVPGGDVVAVELEGVFAIPKDANAIAIGAVVYYDPTAKKASATGVPSLNAIGICYAAALAGDATVAVLLHQGLPDGAAS